MTRKKTTILIYGVLILLAAALVTYGALINSKKVSSPEEDYAKKLAELQADLIKAAAAGGEQQQKPGIIKRKPASKSPKAGST
jgi:uncharacterized protein YpmB